MSGQGAEVGVGGQALQADSLRWYHSLPSTRDEALHGATPPSADPPRPAGCVRAGVGHLVVLSIVGADVVDLDHYSGERRQEALVTSRPAPWTVLHATQFLHFAAQVLQGASGPVAQVPPILSQPVATADGAARLVDLAVGPAQGVTVPIAGPDRMTVAETARQVLARRGESAQAEVQDVPGRTGELMASGALVPPGEHAVGRHTFAEHLETLVPGR